MQLWSVWYQTSPQETWDSIHSLLRSFLPHDLSHHTYLLWCVSSSDIIHTSITISASSRKMCSYITHLRTCFVCSHEETILISEKPCSAVKRGVFGSCGKGIKCSNKSNRAPYQCWRCKEETDRMVYVRLHKWRWSMDVSASVAIWLHSPMFQTFQERYTFDDTIFSTTLVVVHAPRPSRTYRDAVLRNTLLDGIYMWWCRVKVKIWTYVYPDPDICRDKQQWRKRLERAGQDLGWYIHR